MYKLRISTKKADRGGEKRGMEIKIEFVGMSHSLVVFYLPSFSNFVIGAISSSTNTALG